jgi:hypothetical protein
VAEAHEGQRSKEEIEAREALMREQFGREVEAWERSLPVEVVLARLEAKINATR